ncbi:MAG: right-handed parallel beta-helix repeat-containing protein [Bacteroides sp.]|nr:right-handed parallel beta-helix repeat-containing protein [Bacteroides sp.]
MKKYGMCILGLFFSLYLFSAEWYVNPRGSNQNPGTREKPFETIEYAVQRVQADARKGKHTIWLQEGIYYVYQPVHIAETAGKSLTIRACKDGKAVIRGSLPVPFRSFDKITQESVLNRLQPQVRDRIYEISFDKLGAEHIKPLPDLYNDHGGIIELFCGERRMPLSRYPNQGYMSMKWVLINGGGQETEGGSWRDFYAEGAKETQPPRRGIFQYSDPRTAHWMEAVRNGAWLKGYWRIPWQNEAVRIEKIDTVMQAIVLSKPVAGGIGNKYTRPYGNGKEKYWLLNVPEELDMPGEWCLDFANRKLYFYPPEDVDLTEIRVSDHQTPFFLLENASGVTIRGIQMEENLGPCVEILGGNQNHIAGCVMRNVLDYCVKIDGGTDHQVLSNDMYNLGGGGVWLQGGDETSEPRVAAGHRVVNNHIYNFSQVNRIYTPAINSGYRAMNVSRPAVGMYIAHNLIHGTPHGGILFGSFDSVFEYNEIFDYCRVSDDLGAFYSYSRSEHMANLLFRYNFIHSTEEGDGIYFDYDQRDITLYGNIVYLKSRQGGRGTGFLYKIGSQAENPARLHCSNNIAIACNVGYEFYWGLPSVLENNIAIDCARKDYFYREMTPGGKTIVHSDTLQHTNITLTGDPGFADMEGLNMELKKSSVIYKKLPGFKPIPFKKIGLFRDEYRKRLPTEAEIGRFAIAPTLYEKLNSEVLDREY